MVMMKNPIRSISLDQMGHQGFLTWDATATHWTGSLQAPMTTLKQIHQFSVWTLALNKDMHMQAYNMRHSAFVLMKSRRMEPSRMKQCVIMIVLEMQLLNAVATG